MKNVKIFGYLLTAMLGTAFITSCTDDVEPTAAPTISVTADGLDNEQLTGNVGDDVVFTISTETEGGFASINIKESQGTTEVSNETSTTEVTTFTHTITVDDIDAPYVIVFTVEDNEGRTESANAIITGQRTNLQKLQDFNWQYTDQVWSVDAGGDGSSTIKSCEEDNVYTFNEDGSASLDFGEDTATGDCWLDGLVLATGFTYDEDNGTLTIAQDYFQSDYTFQPGDPAIYYNVTFDGLTYTGRRDYDFGAYGILALDETFTAVPK